MLECRVLELILCKRYRQFFGKNRNDYIINSSQIDALLNENLQEQKLSEISNTPYRRKLKKHLIHQQQKLMELQDELKNNDSENVNEGDHENEDEDLDDYGEFEEEEEESKHSNSVNGELNCSESKEPMRSKLTVIENESRKKKGKNKSENEDNRNVINNFYVLDVKSFYKSYDLLTKNKNIIQTSPFIRQLSSISLSLIIYSFFLDEELNELIRVYICEHYETPYFYSFFPDNVLYSPETPPAPVELVSPDETRPSQTTPSLKNKLKYIYGVVREIVQKSDSTEEYTNKNYLLQMEEWKKDILPTDQNFKYLSNVLFIFSL